MERRWFVQVERGPEAGRRFPLPIGETVVGREPGEGIVLADLKVSRRHALLAVSAGGDLRIRDLGAFNGTMVNGQTLAGPQSLRVGDAITIGDTLLRIVDGPAQP